MVDTLAVVMASPGFVFLNEKTNVRPGTRLVSSQDIATRLSYFLTSAPPDEELYQAVEAGAMADRDAYHKQVDRILQENNRRLAEGFASQWADFVRFDSISVSKEYPTYAAGLRHSMKQEVIAYFQTLIRENLPVSKLIQSEFATVNAQLATHYGIPGVTTNEFTKVQLPAQQSKGRLPVPRRLPCRRFQWRTNLPTHPRNDLDEPLPQLPATPPPPNVPELDREQKASSPTANLSNSTKPKSNAPPATARWMPSDSPWKTSTPSAVGKSTKG